MGGVLEFILVVEFRCAECSLYMVFDIEECGGVDFTKFIWYFEVTTVESGVVVDYMIKANFCIVLEDD